MSRGDLDRQYSSWLTRIRNQSRPASANRITKQTKGALPNGSGVKQTATDGLQSPAAEPYRLIAARIEGIRMRRELQRIAITSPLPGEGKTVTSVNVAYILAKDFGRRVLLIDADLRKPDVWRYGGNAPSPGLTDLLAKRQSPEAVIRPWLHEQLCLLEAGIAPVNPTRMWKSSVIPDVLAHFAGHYDYMIFDTPPVLTVVDPTLIADVVDGIVVVARAGMTPKGALQKTLGSLPAAKVLGMILNGVRKPSNRYYSDPYRYP